MLLQKGNSKLGKSIYQFNLPAKITCTPSKWCIKNCYACKGLFKVYEDTIQACYNRSYEASKLPSFIDTINQEIKRHPSIKYIRIHASGDFYSNDYISKWYYIAKVNPNVKFLAFTKRIDLLTALYALDSLPNVVIRESIDESLHVSSYLPKAIIEGSHDIPGFICSGHCSDCFGCWSRKEENVILPAH
jgi:hypothetical protein